MSEALINELQNIDSINPIEKILSLLSEICGYDDTYIIECWQDIEVIINNWDKKQIWPIIQQWSTYLSEITCSPKFVIKSLTLRILLLEKVLEDTSTLLIKSLQKADINKLKPYLASEVQYLLSKLDDETDMNDIEKLRDRFTFVSNVISQLNS